MNPQRVVVVGAGHVGLYVALRLSKKINARRAEVVVIDPQPHMTYQPFLPEAAAGNISPRHSVVPLRRELKRCRIVSGEVTKIEHDRKTVTVQPIDGPATEMTYDHIVVAPGSVSRTLPVPGLRENGIGFKTIGEAIYLRNHILDRLDIAAVTPDPEVRKASLTFVFVGGGYAGIEALAEMEDVVHDALKYYPELDRKEVRFVLVEATNRVLPEVGPDMGAYAVRQLDSRGIDIRLGTRLESCVDGLIKLSDGAEFRAETLVWTAGVKPSPMLERTDLPRGPRGHVTCLPTLQVVDGDRVLEGAWSAGDCAQVPDLTKPGAYCSPSAQHAVRQATLLADNIRQVILGGVPKEYKHKYAGSVASLGLYKGVAQVYGIKLKGLPAWFMHRTYHMSRIPSFNRKIRVLADWTLAFVFKRETVSLGQLHAPRQEFTGVTPPLSDDQASAPVAPAAAVPAAR
ncbi:NAD(P)/FAD-dependent oxidoreductase [Jidongwangia harbinensis]|uniref:NAD(P)/FAD-dependent oxidoreductase n=1 Tax=Jidongwangia harbinensis TaxID=2878561 RepID=UPI001CDA4C0E|nr:NAD(P)/FAD-dependent oxidoreductase [Jidongwangia harbinensis]MCA2215650.1 NAD(P)/FAD-dependent oxidoreductase [Jidongwangia harbinensis]